MFTNLGPDSHNVLGVIAFLPQGINEAEVDWIFLAMPRIWEIVNISMDLSLTHQNHKFMTTLASTRKYLSMVQHASIILSSARDQYIT